VFFGAIKEGGSGAKGLGEVDNGGDSGHGWKWEAGSASGRLVEQSVWGWGI
jgi:hypothetical protein